MNLIIDLRTCHSKQCTTRVLDNPEHQDGHQKPSGMRPECLALVYLLFGFPYSFPITNIFAVLIEKNRIV